MFPDRRCHDAVSPSNSLDPPGLDPGRRQRMRWLDGITDSMDISLTTPQEMGKDREAWPTAVHGILQERTWSGLLCPPLGDLPNPGIKPASFMSLALAGGFFTTSASWEALCQSVRQSVSSVAQSCPTLRDPMNRSTPGLPVHHQLPKLGKFRSFPQRSDLFLRRQDRIIYIYNYI